MYLQPRPVGGETSLSEGDLATGGHRATQGGTNQSLFQQP